MDLWVYPQAEMLSTICPGVPLCYGRMSVELRRGRNARLGFHRLPMARLRPAISEPLLTMGDRRDFDKKVLVGKKCLSLNFGSLCREDDWGA